MSHRSFLPDYRLKARQPKKFRVRNDSRDTFSHACALCCACNTATLATREHSPKDTSVDLSCDELIVTTDPRGAIPAGSMRKTNFMVDREKDEASPDAAADWLSEATRR